MCVCVFLKLRFLLLMLNVLSMFRIYNVGCIVSFDGDPNKKGFKYCPPCLKLLAFAFLLESFDTFPCLQLVPHKTAVPLLDVHKTLIQITQVQPIL
jgi:hypothetical protein